MNPMNPAELIELAKMIKATGMEVQVDPKELEAYFPRVEDSFYLPTNLPENFYFDRKGLKDVSRIGDMRSLTACNLGRLREAGRLGR